MLNSLQNPLSLVGRLLLALLFVPAGFAKIAGFAGTVGYISSKGVPLPEVAAAIAIVVELGLGILLAVGFQTRWAALGIASSRSSSPASSMRSGPTPRNR
jgi:putative oxidoreductase